MPQPDTSAHTLARRRWDQPENVTRRINSIIRRIDITLQTVPSGPQRDRLTQAREALSPQAVTAK